VKASHDGVAAVRALGLLVRKWGGLIALCHVPLLAGVIAAFAQPAVSTYDLQRRDRLPAPTRFAEYTSRFFLGAAPTSDARTRYEQVYVQEGPQAVVEHILASPEASGRPLPGDLGADAQTLDRAGLARQYVALYDAGLLHLERAADGPGRVGFVVILAAIAYAIFWLDRQTRRQPGTSSVWHLVSLPRSAILVTFVALASLWSLHTQLTLDAFTPGRFGYLEWLSRTNDLAVQRGWAATWTPYPQGMQALILLLHTVADALSAWLASDLWTSFTVFRLLFQCCLLLVPSVVLVWLMYEVGATFSLATATLASGTLAFSFATLYYGAVMAYVTDPLAVLCTLVAVAFLIRGRTGPAAVAIGLGSVLKLIPLALWPLLLVAGSDRRGRLRAVALLVLVHVVVLAPFAIANWDVFASPLRWQSSRPPWESWFAFANWIANAPHEYTATYFRDASVGSAYGWVFTGITPPLTALLSPVPAGPPRWENAVSVLGTLAMLVAVLCARTTSPRSLARWGLYCLCAVLTWSVGWSPQYELYVIPLVLLAFERAWIGALAALLLQVVVFLEYPLLLPWAYFYGGSVVWIAWAAILGKYVLLIWFSVFVLGTEASWAMLVQRLAIVQCWLHTRRIFRPGLALRSALLGGVLLGSGCSPVIPPAPTPAPTPVPATPPVPRQAQSTRIPLMLMPNPTLPMATETPVRAPTCSARTPPPNAAPTSSPSGQAVPDGFYFADAGGFSIRDDEQAALWSAFQSMGGWPVLGFPVSQRFVWHGRLAQATQRTILTWNAQTGTAELGSVFDMLHEEGLDDELLRREQIPLPVDLPELNLAHDTITLGRMAWLDDRPAIKRSYCNAPGGAHPVFLWGLPTSPAVDVSGDGSVYVLRSQGAAFQEWVHGAPWAAPGDVSIVLAGDVIKDFDLLPAEALEPEEPPTAP
jgi:hypothetical protein